MLFSYDETEYHPTAEERREAAGDARECLTRSPSSVFDPEVPPLLRMSCLWGMACFFAELEIGPALVRLQLPRPGSIITLAVPVLDENGDTLPAGLDVVALECHEDGSILCSAEREDETPADCWVHTGEWYQRAEEQ